MSGAGGGFLTVGVTGGLASGKSSLCDLLAGLGALVIDADSVSREVTRPGAPTLKKLAERFGTGILRPSGELDRKALGEVAFSTAENTRDLNRLTHPAIMAAIRDKLEALARSGYDGVVVVEAALIMEEPTSRKTFDVIVAVLCGEATRRRRLESLAPEDFEALMKRARGQLPDERKAEGADYVVKNDGSLAELRSKARRLWRMLMERKDAGETVGRAGAIEL